MRWPWQQRQRQITREDIISNEVFETIDAALEQIGIVLNGVEIIIKLSPSESAEFTSICSKEFRRPEDQARLIISEFIKDYNGSPQRK